MGKNKNRGLIVNPKDIMSENDLIAEKIFQIENKAKTDLQLIYDTIDEEKINRPKRYITVDKLSKNKIRSLIGRWFPPSQNQMTIVQVVNDIYDSINKGIEVRKEYYTGKPSANRAYGRYEYFLIIKEKNVLFIDENREICYIIRIRGD